MATFVWHCHHDILVELLTEPFENRVEYIKKRKPVWERETRLRLFKIVQGELPLEVVKAGKAYYEARKAYYEAREAHYEAGEACYEARKAYDEAVKNNMKEILALHALECPNCPWNGKTIFP